MPQRGSQWSTIIDEDTEESRMVRVELTEWDQDGEEVMPSIYFHSNDISLILPLFTIHERSSLRNLWIYLRRTFSLIPISKKVIILERDENSTDKITVLHSTPEASTEGAWSKEELPQKTKNRSGFYTNWYTVGQPTSHLTGIYKRNNRKPYQKAFRLSATKELQSLKNVGKNVEALPAFPAVKVVPVLGIWSPKTNERDY